MTKEEHIVKRKSRGEIFQASLGLFFEQKSQERLICNNKPYQIALVEDGGYKVNEYYWEFVLKHVKPIIAKIGDMTQPGEMDPLEIESKIDIYKILSVTEFAVLAVKPIFVLVNDKPIDYDADDDLVFEENLINATFAFECALSKLKYFEYQYKKEFPDSTIVSQIVAYKESLRSEEAMSIGEEHLAFLATLNPNAPFPVFTNSAWWRLFCLTGFLIKDKKINFNKYLASKKRT